jgi:hypothetical protein
MWDWARNDNPSTLVVTASRSRRATRLSLLIEFTSFFFEPGELGSEATYLSVQLVYLLGMSLFPGSLLLGRLAGEEGRQSLESDVSPLIELMRVDAVLGGELRDALLLAQYLPDDVSLELW